MKKGSPVPPLPASLSVRPRHGEGRKGKLSAPERREASGVPYDFNELYRLPERNLYSRAGNRRPAETKRKTTHGIRSLPWRYLYSPYFYREHSTPVDVGDGVKEPSAAFSRCRGVPCGAEEQGTEEKREEHPFSGHNSYNVIQDGKNGKEGVISGVRGGFSG